MLLFAFALTKSRGGLLSLVGGVGVWMLSRYGWRRAMLLGVLVAPIVLVAFAGRQTEISLDEGTAQSRLMHWRDGIGMVKSSPVTGVGYGMFSDLSGNAAHNSFLHCYAELGFLGGTLFFGLFLLPILALTSTKTQAFLQSVGEFIIPPAQVLAEERQPLRELDQETDRLRSCMLAIIIAYGIGLFALSRSYAVSTYLMLGMVCAMGIIIAGKNPAAVKRLTTRTVAILITTSGCWLVFLYLLVKLLLKAGATK
jgi:O-antigen ligase